MSCGAGCGDWPNEHQPEFKRQWKPENNSGCSCSNDRNSCKTPSLAKKGSPLWEWEQIHGKLITTVTFEQNAEGRMVQKVVKTACPIEVKHTSRHGCCTVRYRVNR
jgi:hypothetical protein